MTKHGYEGGTWDREIVGRKMDYLKARREQPQNAKLIKKLADIVNYAIDALLEEDPGLGSQHKKVGDKRSLNSDLRDSMEIYLCVPANKSEAA